MRDGTPGSMPAFGSDMLSDAEDSGLRAFVALMRSDPSWR